MPTMTLDPTQSAPPPLLTYAVGTQPLPLQASPATGTPPQSTLTLLATNATGQTVTLQALQVTLPVGAGADDLTDTAPKAWMVPAGWAQKALKLDPGEATYVFEPTAGGSVATGQALLFVLNAVQVNSQPGTFQVQVTEGSGGCSPGDCPVQSIPVTKVPAGAGVVSFWATPTVVSPGGRTELGWNGPAGATYVITYYDPERGAVTIPHGGKTLSCAGEYPGVDDDPLVLLETTFFTLHVSMAAEGRSWSGEQQVAVVVGVPAPVITSLTGVLSGPAATPSLTVSWTTENAVSCQLSGVEALQVTNGSHIFDWPLEKSYTLTATGAEGLTARKTVDTPPSIVGFAGTCELGPSGVTLKLSWNALLADSCTISGVPGTFAAPTGSATVTPSAAHPLRSACTLTAANGKAASTATAQVRWGPGSGSVCPPGGFGALSPDGTRLYLTSRDGMLALSVPRLQPVAGPVPYDGGWPASMVVSGSRLLVADEKGVRAYDTTTLAQVAASAPMDGLATCVSPDGTELFVTTRGWGGTWILRAATLAPEGEPLGTGHDPYGVAVSPDGRRLYTAADEFHVQVWSRGAGSGWSRTGKGAAGEGPKRLALSPDGRHLYVLCWVDRTLQALDAGTLQPVLPTLTLTLEPADPMPVSALALALSHDGGRLFVCCTPPSPDRGTVLVVDASTLRQVGEIDGFDQTITMLAGTPDGAALVATTQGKTTHVIPPAGYFT